MVAAPKVSYPITQEVQKSLKRWKKIHECISPKLTNSRSDLEIVRILGNVNYSHLSNLLDFLEDLLDEAPEIAKEFLNQTDGMQLGGRLAEAFLYKHFSRHLPGCVHVPSAQKGESRPDLVVECKGVSLSIEIYRPIDVFGYQLLEEYLSRILKYLEVDKGFDIEIHISLNDQNDRFFPYSVEKESIVRNWLTDFSEQVLSWISENQPKESINIEGPKGSTWRVTLRMERVCNNRHDRNITKLSPTISTDARLMFDVGKPQDLALNYWWGRAVKNKMQKRQAGQYPGEGVVRILFLDFSGLDTGFRGFFRWPNITTQIDEAIRIISADIGDPLCFDVVFPAELNYNCCFGEAVVLRSDIHRVFEDICAVANLSAVSDRK